ncbi:MAG: LptF/LptG family permease [Elusimicrobia bacterium]|nr:LptF/LptG family permease [Elusimicrobiota bacterium]
MNKVFFKYIAKNFWGPFFFGLGVFMALMLFGSLFDKMNFFMKSSSGFGVFIRHLVYQLPYFAVKMMPMATLLAVLFALGGMIARGEWKAGMAGGWRPVEMAAPLIFCSVLAALAQFAIQETVAPAFFMRSEHIFEGKLRGRGDWQRLVKRDVSFSAGDEVFVTAHIFDGGAGVMERVLVNSYKDGNLSTEVNAQKAVWDGARRNWEFYDGVVIKYGARGEKPVTSQFRAFSGVAMNPPRDLALERLVPDGVALRDVLTRIKRLKAIGSPVTGETVLLYSKLAGPLANIVLAVMGLTLVLLIRMSRILSFGAALATGFLFWTFMIMGQSAGEAELAPPLAAGFGPALIFLALSFLGLRKAKVF